ncbi:MAG TPA: zinc ribbon domain-containing protein [Dehalococcoidia bacterium]|nr:zinc ribbon domain-containing protein [Dehalococcoidia bacterium]
MPLYDYRCPKCGLEFEVSRPFSRAGEPVNCPQDGTVSERLFSFRVTVIKGLSGGGESEEQSKSAGGEHDHDHGHSHSHGESHSHSPF